MNLFLTIALVHIVALITPGPDFFFVSQTAVSRSRRQAFLGIVGITLGIAIWAALALLGLQLLLQRLFWLERLITLAGSLYLLWMGLKMLLHTRKAPASDKEPCPAIRQGRLPTLCAGLFTNLANPKAVIYFASVFSAFLGDGVSGVERWGIWALVVAETFLWFCLVAAVFAMPAMRRGYLKVERWIDGFAGAVFVAFGLHLLFAPKR
ncbi:MAG TPA: homoserine/threonine efflux transporter [Dyella sp.]|uniref:homoserine/threonine efflux transporter n=1 Tax=Dyella sp. TaxID=1869338 RepID=UPI002F94E5A5